MNDNTSNTWSNQDINPNDYFSVRYSMKTNDGTEISLSDCQTKTWYIIWRKKWEPIFNNWKTFGSWVNACVAFGSQIVIFNEIPWAETTVNDIGYQDNIDTYLNPHTLSKAWEVGPTTKWWWYEQAEACNYIIKLKWEKTKTKCSETVPQFADGYGIDGWNKRFAKQTQVSTLWTLIDKSKWFVWPLVTIYSSMLNFAQISDTSIQRWTSATIIELFIKSWVAIGMFFPLIALALVLITRIWLLWMIIATAPFIILLNVFKDQIKAEWILKSVSFDNILKIVFAPVVTVFALSISLIFMSALIWWLNNNSNNNSSVANNQSITKSFGFDCTTWTTQTCSTMNGNISIDWLTNSSRSWTLDLFSRLIVNLLAIWLMRFVLFTSFKFSWELWKKIWEWVWKFGMNAMKTVPIVPMWSAPSVWLGTLFDVGKKVPDRTIQTVTNRQQTEITKKLNQVIWEWNTWTGTGTPAPWTNTALTPDQGKIAAGEFVNSANVNDITKKINDKTTKQEEKINNITLTNTANLESLSKWINDLKPPDQQTQALQNSVKALEEQIKGTATKEDIEKIIKQQKDNSIVKEYLKDKWDSFDITTKDNNKITIIKKDNEYKIKDDDKKDVDKDKDKEWEKDDNNDQTT